jgi:UDP-3-O-[3-hydroxymyristoyl] glucosamine N-acyltransferase
MGFRLGELVERLGGQLVGDPELQVAGIAPLTDAGASHISFLSNSKFRSQAGQSQAAALIVSANDDATVAETYQGARIVVKNPYVYFARAAQLFEAQTAYVRPAGVHPSAYVAQIRMTRYFAVFCRPDPGGSGLPDRLTIHNGAPTT